jgi:hypothetical protein
MAMRQVMVMAVIAVSGCAFALQETVPAKWTPAEEPRCSTGTGWAVWDILNAAGDLIIPFALHDNWKDAGGKGNSPFTAAIVVGIGTATLHILSARHGVIEAGKCERARKERDAHARGGR